MVWYRLLCNYVLYMDTCKCRTFIIYWSFIFLFKQFPLAHFVNFNFYHMWFLNLNTISKSNACPSFTDINRISPFSHLLHQALGRWKRHLSSDKNEKKGNRESRNRVCYLTKRYFWISSIPSNYDMAEMLPIRRKTLFNRASVEEGILNCNKWKYLRF